MTDGNISLIDIPDGKPVRAFLPIINRKDRFRVPCTFSYHEKRQFFLDFKHGVLPSNGIDVNEVALISIDIGGLTSSIEATIVERLTSQRLVLEMKTTYTHDQLREFFRVDAVTKVISENFHPTVMDDNDQWVVEGKSIDISGSGVLVSFSKQLPKTDHIKLNISLPNEDNDTISVIARKIRTVKVAEDRWEVAFHFEDIKSEDRDKIIGCCLVLQRQLLRLKVQITS